MPGDATRHYGIDLGTTYSAVAFIDETGRPTMVRNSLTNDETTPSVVYFENADNVVVGKTAKDIAQLYPDRVVSLVKREMGQDRQWDYDGTVYTPESISALILRRLVEDTRLYTGQDVSRAVITVPAYFGMLERDATRKAGEIAGLEVLGIVPEPVAAALEYEVTDGADRTVLVYDLGGGTFDITVIRISVDAIEVLCTDGDQKLGGADWDERLLSFLVDELIAVNPGTDPRDDEQFMQELAITAEETKRSLSQVESRSLPLRMAGASALVTVTRQAFAERTRDLLDRTIDYTRRALGRLREKDPDATIDEVLLVGGSTRMPMVAERLRAEFGWSPRLHDPDLAVAKGAARFALGRSVWQWDRDDGAMPTPEQRQKRVDQLALETGLPADTIAAIAVKKITNVLPKAFGVKLIDTSQPGWEDNPDGAMYVEHLVHADDPLPSGPHRLSARTAYASQTSVEVQVYEQAGQVETSSLSGNKSVDRGAGVISGLPPLPKGSPLDITMIVDEEGLLSVRAMEPRTGKGLVIEVRVGVLSQEDVDRARQAVAGITVRA
ncbi:MAG TPA: Hsp70 family protein [Mycobacteriales bacterium]|nr:Hsp70 family protein [Mycobacteriales bacterium]